MQQKQIQVGSNKLLVLDMPEGVKRVMLCDYVHDTKSNTIFYLKDGWPVFIKIPYYPDKEQGDFKIIGSKDDITEEQWAEIVDKNEDGNYMDYRLDIHKFRRPYCFFSASMSGKSMLDAFNCNYKNALIIRVI